MKMTVTNKKISVDQVEIGGVGSSSVVLVGDTEVITNSSMYDTPSDSLIISTKVPLKPLKRGEEERKI